MGTFGSTQERMFGSVWDAIAGMFGPMLSQLAARMTNHCKRRSLTIHLHYGIAPDCWEHEERRARDSNPHRLAPGGFQDRCNTIMRALRSCHDRF